MSSRSSHGGVHWRDAGALQLNLSDGLAETLFSSLRARGSSELIAKVRAAGVTRTQPSAPAQRDTRPQNKPRREGKPTHGTVVTTLHVARHPRAGARERGRRR
jgi:hypothetical protein